MRIVILDGQTLSADDNPWTELHSHGEVVFHPRSTEEEVTARARQADILITNKARISRNAIEGAPRLKFIAVSATGYDCVDVPTARERGILVANVPEYGSASVAQFTFALLLELCHHVGKHAAAVREGAWSRAVDFCFWQTPQVELAGKTLGIVGLGRIGKKVAELGRAFGMNLVALGRAGLGGLVAPHITRLPEAELFAAADVLTLHCPLTPDTTGLVNRERLRLMKPTAFLINTSRGGLVVEQDLADALNGGRLAGAAVDVVSREPMRSDNPLATARNCLVTPHIAWSTLEARRRLLATTVHNVARFLAGIPVHLVGQSASPITPSEIRP